MKSLLFYFFLIEYQHKMTHYNNLNVIESKLQLNLLKSGIKNGAEVTLNFHQMLMVILMVGIIFHINCY